MDTTVIDKIKKELNFDDYDIEEINSLNFEFKRKTYSLNEDFYNPENLPFHIIRFKKIFRNSNLNYIMFATKINNEFINYIENKSSSIFNPNSYFNPDLNFQYESEYIYNRHLDKIYCFDKEFGACEKDYFFINFDNEKSLISHYSNNSLLEIEVLKKIKNDTLYILFKMYYNDKLIQEKSVLYYGIKKLKNLKNLNINEEFELFLKPFLIEEDKLNITFKVERDIKNPEFIYYYNEELKPLIEVIEY